MIEIHEAKEADAAGLLAIYAPYVEHTAITFEYEVPSLEEFTDRIRQTKTKYPYLVAKQDGKVLGYAYAGQFHAREAYAWAVETSIYVDESCKHMGIGGKLHAALEKALKEQGFLNMNACIAYAPKEDEYRRTIAWNSMRILAIAWSDSSISAGISLDAGMIWSGWRS